MALRRTTLQMRQYETACISFAEQQTNSIESLLKYASGGGCYCLEDVYVGRDMTGKGGPGSWFEFCRSQKQTVQFNPP